MGALRGFPGPRSAAALAAVTYQRGGADRPFAGPLDRVVDAVLAGVRLEGWALWCELSAIAELLVAWAAHPPLDEFGDDPVGDGGRPRDLGEVDRPLAGRLTRVAAAVDRGDHSGDDHMVDALLFASSELSASCGLSRSLADKRVRAAHVLLVEQRLPRVAMLLRAGLLDRPKTELLVSRLAALPALTAECVEERLIPDLDVPVLPDLPHAPDLVDDDPLVEPLRSSRPDLAATPTAAPGSRERLGGWAQLDARADPADPGAVLPAVTRMTLPALRRAIDEALAAVDPAALAEHARRARRDRSVWSQPEDVGTARISATAGAETVAAVINDLDAVAATAKAAGDTRTPAQIRADEFFHRLTQGAHGAPACPTSEDRDPLNGGSLNGDSPNGGSLDGDSPNGNPLDGDSPNGDPLDGDSPNGNPLNGDSLDSGSDSGCNSGSDTDTDTGSDTGSATAVCDACGCHGSGPSPAAPARRSTPRMRAGLQVSLTMTLATWLALRNDPALLGRHDALPGAVARALALDAARDRPDSVTWRCIVTGDEHGTVLGVGRPLSTPRHDPPRRLAELVRTIHPTCVFPGCSVPAHRCDLDHLHPYERGGPTCSCNLYPLCRSHHRLKGSGHVTVVPADSPDGRLEGSHGPADPAPGNPGGGGSHDGPADGAGPNSSDLEAVLRDLDRQYPAPTLPAGSLSWRLRSGKTYLRVPGPATPAPLTPSMHDIPAHLHAQQCSEAAESRLLHHDFADAVRRDRRQRAAAHRESERQSRLAALCEEQLWAPTEDHTDSQSENTLAAVPEDLAELWAHAPLPVDPELA